MIVEVRHMFSPGFRLRIHRTHCWFIRSYEELLYQDLYCLKQYADIRLKVNEYRHPIYSILARYKNLYGGIMVKYSVVQNIFNIF